MPRVKQTFQRKCTRLQTITQSIKLPNVTTVRRPKSKKGQGIYKKCQAFRDYGWSQRTDDGHLRYCESSTTVYKHSSEWHLMLTTELKWKPVVSQAVWTTARKGWRTCGRSRKTYGQFTVHKHGIGIKRKTCRMKQQRRTSVVGLWSIPLTVSCAPECQTGDHFENLLRADSGGKMDLAE